MTAYAPPTMHAQYPVIWLALGPVSTFGWWMCEHGANYRRKYRAVPSDEPDPPGCVWAYEDIAGFGYGAVYPRPATEDEEKWVKQGGRYAPVTGVDDVANVKLFFSNETGLIGHPVLSDDKDKVVFEVFTPTDIGPGQAIVLETKFVPEACGDWVAVVVKPKGLGVPRNPRTEIIAVRPPKEGL